ncbi:MAG TPA: FecR domain-containing protein [Prolixibacteraceae bacterium]|nr:FecR domain-containing protein [Prolixibacteraceae bacterium]
MHSAMNKVEQTLQGYAVPSLQTRDQAWEMLEHKIQRNDYRVKTRVARLNGFVGFASAAAVFFAILYLGMFSTGKYSPEISAGIARVETVELPDGSQVWLNSNSNLKYHVNKFTGERNIVLDGDALFDVEKGGKFLVNFSGGTVKVKGTEFYVSAYTADMIQVDCIDGLVEVSLNGSEYRLGKNTGIKMYRGSVSKPYAVSASEVNERLDGIFYWNSVTLQEVFDRIGYRFGYSIHPDASLLRRNFSGRLELNDLQECLMVVSTAMRMDYTINEENKQITFHAN